MNWYFESQREVGAGGAEARRREQSRNEAEVGNQRNKNGTRREAEEPGKQGNKIQRKSHVDRDNEIDKGLGIPDSKVEGSSVSSLYHCNIELHLHID